MSKDVVTKPTLTVDRLTQRLFMHPCSYEEGQAFKHEFERAHIRVNGSYNDSTDTQTVNLLELPLGDTQVEIIRQLTSKLSNVTTDAPQK